MSNGWRRFALGWLLVAVGCSGTPRKEAVLLVGRSINPHWSEVLAPAVAAPDREVSVVDVTGRTAAEALKPWLKRHQRLIIVPMTVSEADPMVGALREAVAGRAAAAVVTPPGADDLMVNAIMARALRLSQRRSQEGLFVVMDLPQGADVKAAKDTVERLAEKIGHSVDFRPTRGFVWQGEATSSDLATQAKAVLRPLVIAYTVNPGPMTFDMRNQLHGFRYVLDGEGILNDTYYRDWLRGAVGQAATSVASQPIPK